MTGDSDILPTVVDMVSIDTPTLVHARSFRAPLCDGQCTPREEVPAERNSDENDIERSIRSEPCKHVCDYDTGPGILIADTDCGLTHRDSEKRQCGAATGIRAVRSQKNTYDIRNASGAHE